MNLHYLYSCRPTSPPNRWRLRFSSSCQQKREKCRSMLSYCRSANHRPGYLISWWLKSYCQKESNLGWKFLLSAGFCHFSGPMDNKITHSRRLMLLMFFSNNSTGCWLFCSFSITFRGDERHLSVSSNRVSPYEFFDTIALLHSLSVSPHHIRQRRGGGGDNAGCYHGRRRTCVLYLRRRRRRDAEWAAIYGLSIPLIIPPSAKQYNYCSAPPS